MPSALCPFRHRQLQLPLARNVQDALIVLDHIAHGLVVALDEAGDDLALEAAVLALFNDPLADDELSAGFALHSCHASLRPSATDRRHPYIPPHAVAYLPARPAGRFHPTLSADSRRRPARRAGLAA